MPSPKGLFSKLWITTSSNPASTSSGASSYLIHSGGKLKFRDSAGVEQTFEGLASVGGITRHIYGSNFTITTSGTPLLVPVCVNGGTDGRTITEVIVQAQSVLGVSGTTTIVVENTTDRSGDSITVTLGTSGVGKYYKEATGSLAFTTTTSGYRAAIFMPQNGKHGEIDVTIR